MLDRSRIVLGRGSDVDAQLDSAGVSRRHLELYRQGPIYALRDLRSTNGSYLNGRRVTHSALSEGDVLRLGDMLGVVVRTSEGSASLQTDRFEQSSGVLFGPGLSQQMRELERFSKSTLPIVIVGETGTGKECVARVAHAWSGRQGPFHPVNCATLPVGIAEAELFGHRKGAFTGAEQSSQGHVRAAHLGTLFLDEFAELPGPIQAKLLRTLQDGSVVPLGETRASHVDARVIVACQEPLSELVARKCVRPDLAARIDGVTLTLPPLRQRRVDIGVLWQHFLRVHSGNHPPQVDVRFLERIVLFDWRGNVRELELFTRKMLVLHGHEPMLKLRFLPSELRGEREPDAGTSDEARLSVASNRDEHDWTRLKTELERCAGNMTRAAAAVGISRQRAYRLLKQNTQRPRCDSDRPVNA
ncbi:MAG TPA: sigma 54-interacting transcriptional regulator [Polyangiaceae bacterium]|nr:sigma 54-interacting transcriptional regulator [Polyangiaceae bacterium]